MPVSLIQMATALRSRATDRASLGQARAQRLLEQMPNAHRLLTQQYGATRVVLFGSLACGQPHHESDVDLAVEGLPPTQYFIALADLMTLFGTAVDLVRLEEAPPSLAARIAAEGRVL